MKGYEIFAESLKKLGLEKVFGNPGTTEIPMLRGINDYVLTLHDSISLGMADGLSQISRSPALCNLHTMPGLGNSMAFLHTASENRSPVIVTAGQQDYRHIFFDPILSGDLTGIVSNFVKYRFEIKNTADIYRSLKRAYQVAMTPPTGPVFLSFPMNMMDQDYDERFDDFYRINQLYVNHDAVEEIAKEINESSNPALIFGSEIDQYNAFSEAAEFAHRIGCPAYGEPLASRGCYPTDDSQYAGDLPPASSLIDLRFVANDLIVIIGGDLVLYPYTPSPLLSGKKVIVVGTSISGRIGNGYVMNPKLFLKEVVKLVKHKANFSRQADYSVRTATAIARKRMEPLYVASRIRRVFEDHTIVDESISASQILRSIVGYRPDSYFTARTGQLGWALPAAAGISTFKKKVICVLGDGSFMYTLQTLWTIRKYNLPVKVVILNNGGYMILRSFASSYYPDMKDREFLMPEMNIPKMVESFQIPVEIGDSQLENLEWLRAGEEPKVLVVNSRSDIPKMFL
ncbi:MAG: thiamine pyrophosphate-binding protein [Thermoplasmataceae archaeon]|jgi:benzoylformate decarboxylase